jgi:hypothetical protein
MLSGLVSNGVMIDELEMVQKKRKISARVAGVSGEIRT